MALLQTITKIMVVFIMSGNFLFHFVYCGNEKLNVCTGNTCDRTTIAPLLDNQNAPLVARLDLSTANDRINRFIKQEIEEKLSNLTETKLDEVLEFLKLEDKMENYLDKTKQNLSEVISTAVHKMLEESIQLKIAFCATLRSNVQLGKNGVLKFDTVKTNLGQGYSPTTGVFTVPQPSVYEFSVNFIKHTGNNWLELNLIKNDDLIARGFSGRDDYISGSIQVILNLIKGDKIFVRNPRDAVVIHGHEYTMFSGHRI